MTKKEMLLYRRRRSKILRMLKTMTQADIARRLKMTPQRVNQIVNQKPTSLGPGLRALE